MPRFPLLCITVNAPVTGDQPPPQITLSTPTAAIIKLLYWIEPFPMVLSSYYAMNYSSDRTDIPSRWQILTISRQGKWHLFLKVLTFVFAQAPNTQFLSLFLRCCLLNPFLIIVSWLPKVMEPRARHSSPKKVWAGQSTVELSPPRLQEYACSPSLHSFCELTVDWHP